MKKIIDANWHKYVDLGLPSGNLWAICNIGANAPEDGGFLFQWGDSQPCEPIFHPARKIERDFGIQSIPKENDAASVNMGGSWVMPDKKDVSELFKYTQRRVLYINGKIVTRCLSRINNACIAFPHPGAKSESNLNMDEYGVYWTREIDEGYGSPACFFFLGYNSCEDAHSFPGCQYSIRGIIKGGANHSHIIRKIGI